MDRLVAPVSSFIQASAMSLDSPSPDLWQSLVQWRIGRSVKSASPIIAAPGELVATGLMLGDKSPH